ncbi:helix-turn-helix domain-containing protein [Halogeometricum sp. S1BR25-6]|uniref:Helix-turn-helix domain-containing protein n=1 Tax=Halogeometricum salsisoli TaxID=2950536 RepID=A0ABU2GET7_9EURY|nr:bacterio-opsin activator domain-containing protein [Halogeometricum sp. S1BR25-6]MDS0298689.1 helix-turn-helix domain-containing protein [Halogeometricum sp. S1BR25-6]
MSTERSLGEEKDGRSATPVVLVVDDDEDLADTCEYWLRDDYDVRVAYGGEAALDQVDETVDVVLLDRRMPNVSGDDVLEALRDRGLDCHVAMMTAVEPDTDIVDMPFDDYLVKPVTKTDVREAVDELVVRSDFDEEVREFFALESTESALETRDVDDLRDPEVLSELREQVEAVRRGQADEIEKRQRQLDRLHHINDLLREVDRALVDATTREEIEETVCESLASFDAYTAAWVARYSDAVNAVTCRTSAGVAPPRLNGTAEAVTPVVRTALQERQVQLVDEVSAEHFAAVFESDETVPSGLDRETLSAVIVPVAYRDTAYGALVVYTDRAESLGEDDRTVFEELGATIGHGINAAESKRLLYSDTAVELEFSHEDRDDLFVDLSATLGCRVTLQGFSPAADGGISCYLSTADADAEAVLEYFTTHESVENARTITDGPEESMFEVRITGTGSTVLGPLIEFGASVNTLTATNGEGSLAVTVSPDADLRVLSDTVRSAFPAVEVVAKREVEQSVQSTETFKRELEDKLTSRQHDVLETAFVSGYFDWPRGSTAEEVAESLGISAPTFHEHLRSGERKLMEAFFEETAESATTEKRRVTNN